MRPYLTFVFLCRSFVWCLYLIFIFFLFVSLRTEEDCSCSPPFLCSFCGEWNGEDYYVLQIIKVSRLIVISGIC